MTTKNTNKDAAALIYQLVKKIPKGKVSTYGAIGKAIGVHPRIVGFALTHSHQITKIPAHRVVNHKGILTGKFHFETIDTMQSLLEAEGISIQNDQILNFKSYFWDPLQHL